MLRGQFVHDSDAQSRVGLDPSGAQKSDAMTHGFAGKAQIRGGCSAGLQLHPAMPARPDLASREMAGCQQTHYYEQHLCCMQDRLPRITLLSSS